MSSLFGADETRESMKSAFIPVTGVGHGVGEAQITQLRRFNENVSEAQLLLRDRLDLNTQAIKDLTVELRALISKYIREEMEHLRDEVSLLWQAEMSDHLRAHEEHWATHSESFEQFRERVDRFIEVGGRTLMAAPWQKSVPQRCESAQSPENSTSTSNTAFRGMEEQSPSATTTGRRTTLTLAPIQTVEFETLSERGLWLFSTALTILNSVFVGIKVQTNLHMARMGLSQPVWLLCFDLAFAVAFVAELLIRIFVHGKLIVAKEERAWTLFDIVLIITNVMEYAIETLDISFIRALRIVRVTRILRLLRGVTFVHELRLVVASIMTSLTSLVWASVFVTLVLYMVSIFIATDVTAYIQNTKDVDQLLLHLYGSIPDCMLSLFMGISGGNDWAYFMIPLQNVSYYFYTYFFVIYVFITVFGIMNVLTAIFCDAASRVQEVDRDLVIEDQMAQADSVARELRLLFNDCSINTGLDLRALEAQLANPAVVELLKFMELHVEDASGLFKLLDVSGNGVVDVEEFVIGMMRLKGPARSIDMAMLLREHTKLTARVGALTRFSEDQFATLEARLCGDRIARRPVRLEEVIFEEEEKEAAELRSIVRRQEMLMRTRARL